MYVRNKTLKDVVDFDKIYRCKKSVECGKGVFEEGTLVKVAVYSGDTVYVAELSSLCREMLLNYACTFYDIYKVDHDEVKLSPDEFEDYFEEASTVTEEWDNVKYKGKRLGLEGSGWLLLVSIMVLVLAIGIDSRILQVFGVGFLALVVTWLGYGVYVWYKTFKCVSVFLKKYSVGEEEDECELSKEQARA